MHNSTGGIFFDDLDEHFDRKLAYALHSVHPSLQALSPAHAVMQQKQQQPTKQTQSAFFGDDSSSSSAVSHQGGGSGSGSVGGGVGVVAGREELFKFVCSCAEWFPASYYPIVQRHKSQPFSLAEKRFQQLRRGRYVGNKQAGAS